MILMSDVVMILLYGLKNHLLCCCINTISEAATMVFIFQIVERDYFANSNVLHPLYCMLKLTLGLYDTGVPFGDSSAS